MNWFNTKSVKAIVEFVPSRGEGEIAELALLGVLDGRVLQVRLVEVEAPAAEQALVVHLAAAVLVSPVSGTIELVITKPFTQSKGTSPIVKP